MKIRTLISLGSLVMASCQKQSEPVAGKSQTSREPLLEELQKPVVDPPPMTTHQFAELQKAVAKKYSKTEEQLEKLRKAVDEKGAASSEAMALKGQIMKELEPRKEELTEKVLKVIAEKGKKSPEAIALNVELFEVIDYMGDVKLADLPASERPVRGLKKKLRVRKDKSGNLKKADQE